MRRTEAAATGFGDVRRGARQVAALSRRFDGAGWKTAAENVREVRAVPSIFPLVDATLGVGGWPTDRFGLVHGPSNEGKTMFVLGLLLSFLVRGHAAAFIDAERSTPKSWLTKLFPPEILSSPLFRHMLPTSYEQTVDAVRAWCEAIGEAKAAGEIDPNTTGIIVLDSLRKLNPKRLLDKILKEGSEEGETVGKGRFAKKKGGGVDGMSGAAGRYKAQLNAAWMDELTVLLEQTGTAMVAIGREYKAGGATISFGDDWVLGGGESLYFESSVVARIELECPVYVGDKESKRMVGERHSLQVRKTKIGDKEVRYPLSHFHTSNGLFLPYGFDRSRDLLELGEACGVLDVKGAWYSFDGARIGQGEDVAAKRLAEDPELLGRLEAACRGTFQGVSTIPDEEVEPAPDTARSGRAPAAKAAAAKKKAGGKKR
jgi:recombination protein RecA